MRFVYLHLVIYGAWLGCNLTPGIHHFDPTFVISQWRHRSKPFRPAYRSARTASATNKRDEFDLYINLIAEHELMRLTAIVSAIAQKLEVRTDVEHEVQEKGRCS